MADVELDISTERIAAAQTAGDDYTTELEAIRDELDAADSSGTTLGTMVSAQLEMTEAETRYQVRLGIPKTIAKAVKSASDGLKG